MILAKYCQENRSVVNKAVLPEVDGSANSNSHCLLSEREKWPISTVWLDVMLKHVSRFPWSKRPTTSTNCTTRALKCRTLSAMLQ